MCSRADFSLFTIGHSNLSAERFVALLQGAGVTAVADVRSVPFSRRFPWFSKEPLAAWLEAASIAYLPFGAGPRKCIGSTFALQEATLVLAVIARHFSFRLKPGHPVWPALRVTLRPAKGLPMTLRKRPSLEASANGSDSNGSCSNGPDGADQLLAG